MGKEKKCGFSLVELIVVVAIMAVLIGILVPSYLGYIEKTREGLDEHDAEEIRKVTETIILSGLYDVQEEVVVTFGSRGIEVTDSSYAAPLSEELMVMFPDFSSVVPKSKKYKDAVYSVVLSEDVSSTLIISGSWSNNN